jgi:hypothetical protein
MSEAVADVAPARAAAVAPRELRDRRRFLQLLLASLWLLDGLLQLQPFMFTRSFGAQMLAGTARGNPSGLAHSITWADLVIGHHSVVADTFFTVLQILIGLGIAFRPTVKPALALSMAWAACVWWFGEGLGGLFSGTANPVNGAPGAVVLYALLALVLWPADGSAPGGPSVAAAATVGRRTAQGLWVAMWGLLAAYAVLGANRSADGLSRLVRTMASGEPGWLGGLDRHVATALAGRGAGVSAVLAVALALVAVSVYLPTGMARVAAMGAVVLAAVMWVLGENFGGIFSGSATDPNSGPLLVLVVAAYWPLRPRPGHARSSPAPVEAA